MAHPIEDQIAAVDEAAKGDAAAQGAAGEAAKAFRSLSPGGGDAIAQNLALHALRAHSRLTADEVDVLAARLGEHGYDALDYVAFAAQHGVPAPVCAAAQRRLDAVRPDLVTRAVAGARTESAGAGAPSAATAQPARTFTDSLLHQFPLVSRQVENGLYAVKRVAAYLKKLAQHEGVYSAEVLKATSHETTKLDRLSGDGMRSYINTWISTLEIMHTHAQAHANFRSKVMSAVVLPLQAFYKEREAQRKDILTDMARLSKEMKAVNDGVKKAKHKAMGLLEQLRAARDRDAGIAPPEPAHGGGGFRSKLAAKFKGNDSVESLTGKAQEACAAYHRLLADANARKKAFRGQDLPRIFNALNEIEVARLDVLKEHMTKFSLIFHELVSPLEELSTRMVQGVAGIDTVGDVENFIETWTSVHGDPPPETFFKYDLPTSADELRAGRWNGSLELKQQADTIFGATLPEVMEMQRAQFPDAKVPMVVTVLTRAVVDRGGPDEVGIFRISANKTELDALQAQFEKGNYEVSTQSPHVPAGLLKKWLRDLGEPLVPDELYQEAVDAAKDEACTPAAAAAIFNKAPTLTRETVAVLAGMLREVAAKEAENKMSVGNLAIVFSPSFLRCTSADPMEMMMNTKFETRFTSLLLESMFK